MFEFVLYWLLCRVFVCLGVGDCVIDLVTVGVTLEFC